MSKQTQLAILTLDFKPDFGGVQEYLYQISQRLSSYCEVTVITPRKGTLPSNIRFQRTTVPSASPQHFWQALRKIQPTHVLVGHAHPRLMIAARFYGRYATMTHGNDYLTAQKRWHHFLFNKLMAHSSPLLTNSKANAQRLTKIGLPTPTIISPGTDPAQFSPANTPKPPKVANLLTIGRLVPRKGIDTVLQALPSLLNAFPRIRYQIGGDGPDRIRLEQLAATLKLENIVSFLGKIPSESLPDVYRQAHIFVMPTREEAGG
ncbi:MAG TPA: glycosyltransferase, partial [Anaerolineae bacterium]|nr:glycosyltransferase [Anaerolineae bacterium]